MFPGAFFGSLALSLNRHLVCSFEISLFLIRQFYLWSGLVGFVCLNGYFFVPGWNKGLKHKKLSGFRGFYSSASFKSSLVTGVFWSASALCRTPSHYRFVISIFLYPVPV